MPALAVACVSAGVLAYEVLLTRLFSIVQWHHFAATIISIALLGFGASGTALALLRRQLQARHATAFAGSAAAFALAAPLGFALAQRIAFNPLALLWEPRQLALLLATCAVLALPFFFGALCIALALDRFTRRIGAIYAADLAGAALGALGVVGVLHFLHPSDALRAVAGLGLAGAALGAAGATAGRRLWAVAALICAALAVPVGLPDAWLRLHPSEYKPLSRALLAPEARVVSERSGPLGLLSVVDSPRIPFRHADGLSLNTPGEPPPQLGLFTDGEAMSPLNRSTGDPAELAYLDFTTAALPYHLLDRPAVLILGAGGGTAILRALSGGAARVDAVELNPQTVALVDGTHGDFTGRPYGRTGVQVHLAEARSFVAGTRARWDLIEVPPRGGFAAAAGGVLGLGESYTDTVEALATYLARLRPGGLLAVTRWLEVPPRGAAKLLATVIAALERHGVADPADHIVAVRGWQSLTVVAGPAPVTADQRARARAFAEARAFDLAYLPGLRAEEANRHARFDRPYLFEAATALLGPDRDGFVARYKFDIRPPTDDRPFSGDVFKWAALPELLALRAGGGAGLVEWSDLLLLATLALTGGLGVVLIALPLALRRLPAAAGGQGGRVLVYFLAIGFAFMFVEIAFIQRLTLFLGHPVRAIAVALAAFLGCAAAGSATVGRLDAWASRRAVRVGGLGLAVAGVALTALVYLAALPSVLDALMALPLAAKMPIALAAIAPLAFWMGMPFPAALSRVADGAPDLVPWAWAINGCASVAGATLAALLAREVGFAWVLAAAAALYLLAGAAAPRPTSALRGAARAS